MATKRRYFKELRIQQLRALVELARGHGFAGAAAALELTTPSVWQQIRGLESQFGVALVQVNGLQVSLTEYGMHLVDLATPLVRGFDSIQDLFADRLQKSPRKLTIAAPVSVLTTELPEPIQRYREHYPDVELTLIDSLSNPARKLLEDGDVDLAVIGQLETTFPPSLVADAVTSYPLTLVCLVGHPVLSIRDIRPMDLVRYPLVMLKPGANSRQRVDEIFNRRRLQKKLQIAITASTKELMLHYVKMRFGIAVVAISPQCLNEPTKAQLTPDGLVLRDVSNVFGHEHIVILRRRHQYESAHQSAFREMVLKYASSKL